MIQIRVNGKTYEVPNEIKILEACRQIGVYIPTLCYHSDIPEAGQCGLCSVKIDGTAHGYACMTHVRPNMVISTTDPDIIEKSQKAFDRFMDMAHPPHSPDIEEVMNYLFEKKHRVIRKEEKTPSITFNPDECINCDRCLRMCADVIDVGALDDPTIGLKNGPCIACGQCTWVCPTKALAETPALPFLFKALATRKTMVCVVDPSVLVSMNDAFDLNNAGIDVTGKVCRVLRSIGFQYVFDVRAAVDIATSELAEEFIARVDNKERLPLIPATCPAVVNFIEKSRPDLTKNLSVIKSPAQIFGQILKGQWASSHKIKPENVFVVEVTSCVGAKNECRRMQLKGFIDISLTVREVVEAMHQFGIEWSAVRPDKFDEPFTCSSAAATRVGLSGGWSQAVLKYIYEKDMKQAPSDFVFKGELGCEKEAKVSIGKRKFNMIYCDGMNAGHQLLSGDDWKNYDFIEILACPGGCPYGGGQPKMKSRSFAKKRSESLNNMAKAMKHPSAFSALPAIKKMIGSAGIIEKVRAGFTTHYEPQESATLQSKRRSSALPIIGYGSTNGRATRYARLVAGFVHTSSQTMNNITIDQVLSRKTAIFIISTYGRGEYPANAMKFCDALSKSTADMSEVRFAVLGLGRSSAKERFCAAGVKLHEMLVKRGAKPILPLTKVDSLEEDGGDKIYAIWSNDLATALYLKKPKVGLELVNQLEACEDTSIIDAPSRPIGYEMAEIVETVLMSPEGYIPAMRKYTVKLPAGMTYEPGDHVNILPCNDDDVVDKVLKALGLAENAVFSLAAPDPIIPQKVSIRQLFKQYLDLNCLPTRALLLLFLGVANDAGKPRLQKLTDEKDTTAFKEYLKDINTAECLVEMAQYGIPPLNQLISAIPHMNGRLYSIASSPDSHRGFLELIVLDVVFGENNKRYGISTHFLSTPGLRQIALFCKKGTFRYPADSETPIIMVGLGAGVSPMFSLLQHRQMSEKKLGPAYLFFGARYQGSYPLLMKKLRNFHDTKVIDELFTAFSRDGPNKVYIQDVMKQQSAKLWELWQDSRTQFYYCGPKRSIVEDLKELMLQVTIHEGWLSREEAMAYNSRHEWTVEAA